MDGTSQVTHTAALIVRTASWLRDEEAASWLIRLPAGRWESGARYSPVSKEAAMGTAGRPPGGGHGPSSWRCAWPGPGWPQPGSALARWLLLAWPAGGRFRASALQGAGEPAQVMRVDAQRHP